MASIQTRAGRVAYHESGSGPTVLLLHATLHDRHDYDPIIDVLARRYRTIAVDWPGHGESEPVDGALEPSAPLFADALEDVVDGLGLSRAVLIGNSVGGFAAARLAITRPGLVAGLILVNTGGFVPLNPLSRSFCRMMSAPAVWRAAPLFVRGYMKAKTDSDRAIAQRAIARARTDDGIRTATGLWRSFATPEHDLRGRATGLSAPTLIIWGKRDIAIPLSSGRIAHEVIRVSQLEILDTGHVVFSSDPQGFLAVAQPFLESVAVCTTNDDQNPYISASFDAAPSARRPISMSQHDDTDRRPSPPPAVDPGPASARRTGSPSGRPG